MDQSTQWKIIFGILISMIILTGMVAVISEKNNSYKNAYDYDATSSPVSQYPVMTTITPQNVASHTNIESAPQSCLIGDPTVPSKSKTLEIFGIQGQGKFENSFYITGRIRNNGGNTEAIAVSGTSCDPASAWCASSKRAVLLKPGETQNFSIVIDGGCGGRNLIDDCECLVWIDTLK